MKELRHSHHRNPDVNLTLTRTHVGQYLPNGLPGSFGRNENAGIENYSHAGGFHGRRLLTISATSAAKWGSRVGSQTLVLRTITSGE
jgi:hypothetical protein